MKKRWPPIGVALEFAGPLYVDLTGDYDKNLEVLIDRLGEFAPRTLPAQPSTSGSSVTPQAVKPAAVKWNAPPARLKAEPTTQTNVQIQTKATNAWKPTSATVVHQHEDVEFADSADNRVYTCDKGGHVLNKYTWDGNQLNRVTRVDWKESHKQSICSLAACPGSDGRDMVYVSCEHTDTELKSIWRVDDQSMQPSRQLDCSNIEQGDWTWTCTAHGTTLIVFNRDDKTFHVFENEVYVKRIELQPKPIFLRMMSMSDTLLVVGDFDNNTVDIYQWRSDDGIPDIMNIVRKSIYAWCGRFAFNPITTRLVTKNGIRFNTLLAVNASSDSNPVEVESPIGFEPHAFVGNSSDLVIGRDNSWLLTVMRIDSA
jgi:hypothetical protein